MGVYTRFKQKDAAGFRALVELLESAPASRRQRMIDVGMAEDAEYTRKALDLVLTFNDIVNLSDLELAELIATSPSRTVAFAIKMAGEEIQQRFLKNSKPRVAAEIKDQMETNVGLSEVGGAQLKLVEQARKLEKSGVLSVKRIPT